MDNAHLVYIGHKLSCKLCITSVYLPKSFIAKPPSVWLTLPCVASNFERNSFALISGS